MANITSLSNREQIFRIIAQWEQGFQKKKEVCKNNNLTVRKFDYWLKKYRSSKIPTDFVEIKAPKKKLRKEQIIKFHFTGGVMAEVPSNLAMDFMNQLIVR